MSAEQTTRWNCRLTALARTARLLGEIWGPLPPSARAIVWALAAVVSGAILTAAVKLGVAVPSPARLVESLVQAAHGQQM